MHVVKSEAQPSFTEGEELNKQGAKYFSKDCGDEILAVLAVHLDPFYSRINVEWALHTGNVHNFIYESFNLLL